MSATLPNPRRSGWIPYAFAGGMLLVVAVNAVLIFAAVGTFTGVTVGKAYDKGRAYNHVLAEAARQDALGWRPEVALEAGLLRVTVRDRDGRPVAGRLEGVLHRPVEGAEAPVAASAAAPGTWIAEAPPRPGQWEARLRLTAGDGRHLDIRRRVVVP